MAEIPRAVLSERFQEHMRGRRLKSAVFLTFRFDPAFFEQEVLPVLLDIPLSHVGAIRLLQLEDALKSNVDEIAVYYDRGALIGDPAKLDIRRTPVSRRTGFFHPKNVLALAEDIEPDEGGYHCRHLIVAAMSANLTRAGWWENVEACHIEEVSEGQRCGYRNDLRQLARQLKRESPPGEEHRALQQIQRFLTRVDQRKKSKTEGAFHSRLYTGLQSVPDFVEQTFGHALDDLYLEVISPYFDNSASSKPLMQLIERFHPREVRILLPRGTDGRALCKERYYTAIKALPNAAWGRLKDQKLLRGGSGASVAERTVHAKVYRFFHPRRRFEVCLVGSVNLTNAAHSEGGNFETAFLVQTQPRAAPDWWLSIDRNAPLSFQEEAEDSGAVRSRGAALAIRFFWDSERAEVYWNEREPAPQMEIQAQGVRLFELNGLPPLEWKPLAPGAARELARVLRSTSFLSVLIEGEEPALVLVQEEAMAHKPSLLHTLSAADILRYWSLLTPEQRADFLEERIAEIPDALREIGLEQLPQMNRGRETLFDTFAGVFHAFGSLERAVRAALENGREKEAVYRLFGKKYDSLPRLLDRVLDEETEGDHVLQYVIVLSAEQLLREVESTEPEFFDRHRSELRTLRTRLSRLDELRQRFAFGTPEERQRFFEWFDHWFITRAAPEAA